MSTSTLDNIIPTILVVAFSSLVFATLSFFVADAADEESLLESIALNIFGVSICTFIASMLVLPFALIAYIWS